MITFTTPLKKFDEKGEKTGWYYIEISKEQAHQIKPDIKKSFRIKGKINNFKFAQMALLPMGDGDFILALKADIRRKVGARLGNKLNIELEADDSPVLFDADFMECLQEDKNAFAFFKTLTKSHQHYFSKWIASAKTDDTKAKRILKSINALNRKLGYAEMLREKVL